MNGCFRVRNSHSIRTIFFPLHRMERKKNMNGFPRKGRKNLWGRKRRKEKRNQSRIKQRLAWGYYLLVQTVRKRKAEEPL